MATEVVNTKEVDRESEYATETLRGKVKWYNDQPNKQFGFIMVDLPADEHNEEETIEVFFHLHRRREYYCDGTDTPALRTPEDLNNGPVPGEGDEVILQLVETDKGVAARFWAFPESYDEALYAIANRTSYRFMVKYGVKARAGMANRELANAPPKVLWEGNDIRTLRRRFPVNCYPAVENPTIERWFEMQNDNDTWEKCGDPR